MKRRCKWLVIRILFTILIQAWNGVGWASFGIQSEETVNLEIRGYNGLAETILFKGELAAGEHQNVITAYSGLALLLFKKGQGYPIITGKHPFLIKISRPESLPSFIDSAENEYLYAILRGTETATVQYEFADLMIDAKKVLDSTGSIRTMDELQAMKEKFHDFVRTNYQGLYHSDMLRRLMAQYFMMHEYVNYHSEGAPATDIRERYRQAVIDGVRSWSELLQPRIPNHEVLNYILSLYYDRSMVSMAFLISQQFKDKAYCPGEQITSFTFADNLPVTDAKNSANGQLGTVTGSKIIALVSEDCPVSMIATVIKARKVSPNTKTTVIVAPLPKLSEKHLSMATMVVGGNLLFINGNSWKEHLPQHIRLPFFKQID